jgi:molybdate transport system regulatory protein
MNKPQVHIRIDFTEVCSIGPGKIALLEAIRKTGSLSAAARALGMSYRRAWLLLHSINNSFASAAVELSVGGRDGGGARLTDFGAKLIQSYREFESAADILAMKTLSGLRPSRDIPATNDMKTRRPVSRPLKPASVKRKKQPL